MRTTVQKWGNSLAFRVPSAVAKDLGLRRGSAVEVSVEDGKMTVSPARTRKVPLARLLAGITKDNRPAEQDWGSPVGREAW